MSKTAQFWLSLVGAIAVAFLIAYFGPGKVEDRPRLAIEYGGLIMIFLFGFIILVAIASGEINIGGILQEKGSAGTSTGSASMARFQLLIFTFVIAISLFLIVVNKGVFPDKIPPEILTLLGISASTYAVSKGIQSSSSNGTTSSSLTTTTTPTATSTTTTTTTKP